MRDLTELDKYRDCSDRILERVGHFGDGTCGAFKIPSRSGPYFYVIASSGEGWDHVSVTVMNQSRCPTWEEMENIKRLFFKETETAMQLHVPPKDHINYHPYCLHMWRPLDREIPLPPPIMVGPS